MPKNTKFRNNFILLGILIIIPYLLYLNNGLNVLKFYLPLLIAFANLLTKLGDNKIFGNLYKLQPDNYVSFLSSNFINLFTLFGILWQCLEYSKSKDGTIPSAIAYGALLFVIAFPLSRNGLSFTLDKFDEYIKEKTNMVFPQNWHLIVVGLFYIILLLSLQSILLLFLTKKDQKKQI